MKRKVYATARERKTDQIKGFWAFPLVNVPLWIIHVTIWQMINSMSYFQRIDSQEPTLISALPLLVIRGLDLTLPWLVNGIVLVLAFLFRPEFGVGYAAFIAVAITASTALSILFVAACFVSVLSAAIIGNLAIGLFAILMLGGLFGLGVFAIYVFRSWRSSYEDTSQ